MQRVPLLIVCKAPAASPGITYMLKSTVYVSLTNRCNARTLIETRGPSFLSRVSELETPCSRALLVSVVEVKVLE